CCNWYTYTFLLRGHFPVPNATTHESPSRVAFEAITAASESRRKRQPILQTLRVKPKQSLRLEGADKQRQECRDMALVYAVMPCLAKPITRRKTCGVTTHSLCEIGLVCERKLAKATRA
ncbi:unnamed protein product, partial [Ixodes pacificus]